MVQENQKGVRMDGDVYDKVKKVLKSKKPTYGSYKSIAKYVTDAVIEKLDQDTDVKPHYNELLKLVQKKSDNLLVLSMQYLRNKEYQKAEKYLERYWMVNNFPGIELDDS